jgi:hypothetical protein
MYLFLFCSAQIVLTCSTADSPYPSTPTLSPLNSDPSVAEEEDNQKDADPFKTSARVVERVEKALAAAVSAAPLKLDPRRIDLQGSLSSTEGMVRTGQTSANVLALGQSASHLDRPVTRGGPFSFHHSPRQYILDQKDSLKPNGRTPNAVFVLRSSPQIIEEGGSDDEFWSEDEDDDKSVYSFPCEDSKINELVSAIAGLSLGTISTAARPTYTPTRLRARDSPFIPARTPVSSPMAVLPPVIAYVSTTQHTMPMEVDQDVLYPKPMTNDASRAQGTFEGVPMDGLVFHPEANDMEMADTFVTIRKLFQVAFLYFCFSLIF